MENKKKGNYLTLKESRKILKYNIQQMKYYEGLKKRKLLPHEYQSTMVDENNIIEIDNFIEENNKLSAENAFKISPLTGHENEIPYQHQQSFCRK